MHPMPKSNLGSRSSAHFLRISHPEIVYPVAATVTAKPEADTYLKYSRSAAAKAVFEQYGFVYLIP